MIFDRAVMIYKIMNGRLLADHMDVFSTFALVVRSLQKVCSSREASLECFLRT